MVTSEDFDSHEADAIETLLEEAQMAHLKEFIQKVDQEIMDAFGVPCSKVS